ncbi:hypothetical protein TrLO_g9167 [Triparma laevis f. longispina]|uniref:Core domain-containing protein n=1 Tax=Triparma laevis f. longispina TaxID=1714387 RepID=A0A9W7EF68_9STRA|nr:hypothetical protein TrLO_g9167 [Triparma laevis f. longispina]
MTAPSRAAHATPRKTTAGIRASHPWLQSARAFSAEPVSAPKKKARRKTRLPTKAPIVVTEGAAERIAEILEGRGDDVLGLRLGVKRRGCNGLSFTMNYVEDNEADLKKVRMDETVTCANGVVVYVDPSALFNIVGTVMDWEETELSAEFTFNNPNATGECGCGESFSVES